MTARELHDKLGAILEAGEANGDLTVFCPGDPVGVRVMPISTMRHGESNSLSEVRESHGIRRLVMRGVFLS